MRCTQPGCVGEIQDGYCNVCGMAASSAAPLPPPLAGAAAGPDGGAGSTRTSSSQHLASAPLGSARGGTNSARTRRLAGASRQLSRIGAGITSVPSTPVTSPLDAIMKVAEVAEDKRFCPKCNAPVGRSRDGKPGRTEGFCPKCGTKFSFTPKLKPGDLVGGQYEVAGCLAHGGLGWIYLARDRNVSDRFVVLKGLLNSGDTDAYQAAIAERQFLAEVQHPLIVEIYNFVIHDGAGYTVMEFVGGKSLKQILKARQQANGGAIDPLPVDQSAAYLIEILPAMQYLHTMGLLYCDFKPDNVIQEGDALKLIDLGGVRRADDTTSAIYGTVGFQAPEVATVGPSIASDIFTVARTLVVLAMDFRGYQSTYATTLPPYADAPLFQRHDSLYRFVLKGTAPDPNDRFQSADEMREQLLGVLREIVALERASSVKTPLVTAPSALFTDPAIASAALTWRDLPTLRPDTSDPATSWLSSVSIADPVERLRELDNHIDQTREVALAAILAAIEAGEQAGPQRRISAVLDADPWEWRAVWYAGLAALAAGDAAGAVSSFNAVFGAVPGELAPKLALAHACELAGNLGNAVRLYEICARTDAAYVAPGCFGVARVEAMSGNLAAALDALDRIPSTSRAYVEARRTRIELQLGAQPDPAVLAAVADEVNRLGLDPRDRSEVRARVFGAALAAAGQGASGHVAGVPLDDRSLRLAIEEELRHRAKLTEDRAERVRLIDEANLIRPRTLV
jgi:serine/threonine-protein kinase PknG